MTTKALFLRRARDEANLKGEPVVVGRAAYTEAYMVVPLRRYETNPYFPILVEREVVYPGGDPS